MLFDTVDGRLRPAFQAQSRRAAGRCRVAVEAHKKNPGDFVLWKLSASTSRAGTALGRGRPRLAHRMLGDERGLSRRRVRHPRRRHRPDLPASTKPSSPVALCHGTEMMANVWNAQRLPAGQGRKMSKSEGNFITIYELLHTEKFGGRRWPGEVLRPAMLMTHYREPIDFSIKRLEEAEHLLSKWPVYGDAAGEADPAVVTALADDLNTRGGNNGAACIAQKASADSRHLGPSPRARRFSGGAEGGRTRRGGRSRDRWRVRERLELLKARTTRRPTASAPISWQEASSSRTARIPRPAKE